MQTIPILWKRESWLQHRGKLSEEFTELCHELHEIEQDNGNTIDKVVAESLDVIQVAIGIIDKAVAEYGVDAQAAIAWHVEKLLGRGWGVKGWIEVDVMMGVSDDSLQTVQKVIG